MTERKYAVLSLDFKSLLEFQLTWHVKQKQSEHRTDEESNRSKLWSESANDKQMNVLVALI